MRYQIGQTEKFTIKFKNICKKNKFLNFGKKFAVYNSV